jgi:hypothetical protein
MKYLRKFGVALVAIAAAVVTFGAAPASATTQAVCTPITLEGVEITCLTVQVDATPASNGDVTLSGSVTATVLGQLYSQSLPTTTVPAGSVLGVVNDRLSCFATVTQDGTGLHVDVYGPNASKLSACDSTWSLELGVGEPSVGTRPWQPLPTSVPVHVPQVCVTTTGTCVGGSQVTVPLPLPSIPLPSVGLPATACYDSPPGMVPPSVCPTDVLEQIAIHV